MTQTISKDRDQAIAELDTLPQGAIVRCVRRDDQRFAHVWEKYSRNRWLHLDPDERYDGESDYYEAGVLFAHEYGSITVIYRGTGELTERGRTALQIGRAMFHTELNNRVFDALVRATEDLCRAFGVKPDHDIRASIREVLAEADGHQYHPPRKHYSRESS